MKSCCESRFRATHTIKISVEASSAVANGQKLKIAEIEIKGHFCPSYDATDDVKMFPKADYSTKKVILGSDKRQLIEHGDQPLMALIIKESVVSEKMKYSKYPWTKRVQQVIPASSGEEDTDNEEEYDAFEEVIVVMNVKRKPIWRTWLERPQPPPETARITTEDLIEITSLRAKTAQESSVNELFIEEKIEFVERPPVNLAALPDLSFLENI